MGKKSKKGAKQRSAKKKSIGGIRREDIYNEVDEFMEQNDTVALNAQVWYKFSDDFV